MVAFATGALTPVEQEALELHMAGCAGCRELADAQKTVWSALDGWAVPAVSEDFDRRLQARIVAEERRRWWRLPRWEFSWKPVLPVTAACAALLAVFVLHDPLPPNNTPAAPPAVVQTQDAQKVDVDQVERALDDMDMLNQLNAPVPSPNGSRAGS